jgi:long-chain acyl-CoA synthetase
MNILMDKMKEAFSRDSHKRPWEKYYKKNERNIKVPNMSAYEYLRECNKDNMDAIAINYFNKTMTFRYFFGEVNLCAKALRSQGIRPGDVVTVLMANTPEAVIAFYAINKIGAIANMVHPLSAEEEIKHSLLSTKSVMLIAINVSCKKVMNIIEETDVYKTVVVSPGDSMPTLLKFGYYITQGRKIEVPKKSEDFMFWNDFMMKGKNYTQKVLVKTTNEQPAAILHSGGTTGTPKNIVLTNGNFNALSCQARIIFPLVKSGDSMLTILPLFHCFGLCVCVHGVMCLNGGVTLIPQFDAKKFDSLLSKYKPTLIAGVPTLFEAMMNNKKVQDMDLSYIKYLIVGGDSLTEVKNNEMNKFIRSHGIQNDVVQGYGMTETSGPTVAGVMGTGIPGAIGIPLPGNDMKIVNIDTKEEVPYGEVGEICISGPVVMPGYLDNEKETNEMLEKDEKGKIWVHTGDLGYVTEEGILYYVQRLKRMLIVSGYNVYPSHVENVLMEHPAILNCGVIGIPHPYKVQVPKAFIVLNSGYKADNSLKKEIKEYCEKNLAFYMIPKEFVFRESLPKTMIGKVNYRELEKEEKENNK